MYEITQSISGPLSVIVEKNNFENAKFLTIDQNLKGVVPPMVLVKKFSHKLYMVRTAM